MGWRGLPVCVQRPAAEQLVANGNEFCVIVHPMLLKMRGYPEGMNDSNQSLSGGEGGLFAGGSKVCQCCRRGTQGNLSGEVFAFC
jgi:hypothetical protein